MDKYSTLLRPVIRIVIGTVFLLSSIGKIAEFTEFALFVGKLTFTNDLTAILISSFLIGLELLIGACLIVKLYTQEASIVAGSIIVLLFIPFTIYALINDTIIDCGCFGAIEILNTNNQLLNLLKNILLLSGVVYIRKYEIAGKFNYKIFSLYTLLIFTPIFLYNYIHLSDGLSLVEYVEIEEYIISPDDYILIDARDYSIYLQEHIDTAISIPFLGSATNLSELSVLLSKQNDKKILTYCDAASCALARLLALQISSQFKIPTYELKGGIEEWRKFTN